MLSTEYEPTSLIPDVIATPVQPDQKAWLSPLAGPPGREKKAVETGVAPAPRRKTTNATLTTPSTTARPYIPAKSPANPDGTNLPSPAPTSLTQLAEATQPVAGPETPQPPTIPENPGQPTPTRLGETNVPVTNITPANPPRPRRRRCTSKTQLGDTNATVTNVTPASSPRPRSRRRTKVDK
jgi:hypothetical protein